MLAPITVTETVKLTPIQLGMSYKAHIAASLSARFGNRCSRYGFVLRDTITLEEVHPGSVESHELSGNVTFPVVFTCMSYDPRVDDVVVGTVRGMNRFGLLVVTEVQANSQAPLVRAMETIIPRMALGGGAFVNEVDPSSVEVGDTVSMQIKSKKVEVNGNVILSVGRMVVGMGQRDKPTDPIATGEVTGAIINGDDDDDMVAEEDVVVEGDGDDLLLVDAGVDDGDADDIRPSLEDATTTTSKKSRRARRPVRSSRVDDGGVPGEVEGDEPGDDDGESTNNTIKGGRPDDDDDMVDEDDDDEDDDDDDTDDDDDEWEDEEGDAVV